MEYSDEVKAIKQAIQKSMDLYKCTMCGCMKETLEYIKIKLLETDNSNELIDDVENSIEKMEPIKYSCLGCKHCWSADITNAFDEAFTDLSGVHLIQDNITYSDKSNILPAVGEYHVLRLDYKSPITISTLGNAALADKIAELNPKGLSIVGKTETENIGIEKIIKNVLAVPSIKYLILCGNGSEGHYSGNTLLSLIKNGVDDKKKVIDSKGKKPVLSNTTIEEVEAFRKQIEIIDMIGCEDLNEILDKIKELLKKGISCCNCGGKCSINDNKSLILKIETINADEKDPNKVKLDKAGYFVIIPKADSGTILVEHYSNTNKLLRIIKGINARNIYWTIIENEWVTELSHAAYLGKELTKAEMSLKTEFKYIQDKA